MNAIQTQTEPERLCDLLKEYAGKLRSNVEQLLVLQKRHDWDYDSPRLAWLIDSVSITMKPLETIMSRASGLLEHSKLDSFLVDELTLRLTEIKLERHHALSVVIEITNALNSQTQPRVANASYASGLDMSPLRKMMSVKVEN